MAGEQRHRRVFLLLAILLGLPTLVVGGSAALLGLVGGIFFGLAGGISPGEACFLVGWSTLGIAGLIGGLRLSRTVLRDGSRALRQVGWLWWAMMLAGMVAALPLAAVLVLMTLRGEFATDFPFAALFVGPLILLPALHLLYLRFACHRDTGLDQPDAA